MKHLFVARIDDIRAHLHELGAVHWIDLDADECVAISERSPPPRLTCHRCPHVLRGQPVGDDFSAKTAPLGITSSHTTLDAIEILGAVNPLFTAD